MSRELNISTQSMSRLIRDDLHMRAHPCSKGRILTRALKAIRLSRAERLLQWHAENGHENLQNNKIYAQASREVMENVPRVQGGHHPSYVTIWWEVSHHGVSCLHLCKKGVKLVSESIKRTCYMELWNILTWPYSVVRNGSSSRTQFLIKRPRQLRGGCEGTFWTSCAPRTGFRGVQTSNPWKINCGLFCRTWRAKSVTTAWRAWGDPLWRQRQRSPWRRSVRRQQSGRSVSGFASRHRVANLSDIIINENLKLLQINYLAWKVDVLFNFPSRSCCICNRTRLYTYRSLNITNWNVLRVTVSRRSYCFCQQHQHVCALLFILLRLVWNDCVTRKINFPYVGAVFILYKPRDERHWKCLLICIPSGIHSRHFLSSSSSSSSLPPCTCINIKFPPPS